MDPTHKDDLVKGLDAIAALVGLDRRVTAYYLERGIIPGVLLADEWVVRYGDLQTFVKLDQQ